MTQPARHRFALPLLLALCAASSLQAQGTADAGVVDAALAGRVHSLVSAAVMPPAEAGAQARVLVQIGKLDPRLRLAPCKRVEPQLPSQGSLWGRVRIGLRCVDGERPWQVWLPVEVKLLAPALVPARALSAGTVLQAEHLQSAEVDWAAETQAPFSRAENLVGRTLGRALPAGQAIRSSDLRQRQWFAAGDTVQLRARGQGFTVGGEGQALGHGLEGQSVRVRTESGRVLTGMPVGERQVELTL